MIESAVHNSESKAPREAFRGYGTAGFGYKRGVYAVREASAAMEALRE